MKTQKKYRVIKEFLTFGKTYLPKDTVSEDRLIQYYSYDTINFMIDNGFIELIPEKKMEVITVKDICVYYETNDILIKHPTPLMKQVVRQIEKGECYESKLTSSTLKDYIDFNNGFAISIHTSFTSVNRNYKLLIIPMEANNE